MEVCGNSPWTIRHYGYALKLYLEHLGSIQVDFKEVGYKDLITFLQTLRLAGLGDGTVRARLSAISSWYRWLKRIKVVKENPCELVGAIKAPETLPEFFTEAEAEKLLEGARTYPENVERNVAMLEFIYASGCRRGEVERLNVDDIHGGKDPFATVKLGKGKRDRLVLLSHQFMKAWDAYVPVRARLLAKWERPTETAAFLTCKGTRMDGQCIYYNTQQLCVHAGVRKLYPHAIRHSAATHMMNNGADLMDIKEQLGHSSLHTTQVYLHVALERRRAQYRRSHPSASSENAAD